MRLEAIAMQYTDILAHIVDVAWGIMMIVWLVSAFSAKRTIKSGGSWWLYRIFAGVIVVLILRLTGLKSSIFLYYIPNMSLRIIGTVLVVLGIVLAVWARFYLGRNWGMPLSEKEGAELVTSGPYAYIRNPIYAGVFLALLGSVLVFGALWLLILVLYGAYFMYSVFGEEKIMERLFPNRYPAYRARTKRIIPWVW